MGRGPSAYFIFCGEKRAEARTYVEAAAEPGQKISVATVAKRLGELWKALTDEEKQGYKDQVIEAAKAAAEEAAAPASPTSSAEGGAAPREVGEEADAPTEGGEDAEVEDEEGGKREAPMGLPISLVKRIMCCDEDVQRVTSGAVRATARAAELFIQMLAAKSLTRARQAKRKNLKFSDLEQVVRADRRCIDMCLKDVLCSEPMFAEARGETAAVAVEGDNAEKENEDTEAAPRPAKMSKASMRAAAAIAGVRPITSFFKA